MRELAAVILVSAAATGALFWVLETALSRPVVFMSWADQKCVRVVESDGTAGSCEAIPQRYELVWVQ